MSKLDKLQSMVPMEEIEQSAQQQIYDVLSLECLKKLAIMPDVHAGYDLPIGGVALLDGMISPSFVGFDVGCGMCSVDTNIPQYELSKDNLKQLYDDIVKTIPTGFSSLDKSDYHFEYVIHSHMPKEVKQRVKEKSVMQLGTLGGGNHFIEIGISQNTGTYCVTIHSGSRNVGHTIGGWYMKQGRMFPLLSDLGLSYLGDMNFALEWALYNRLKMINKICKILGVTYKSNLLINENHNHAIITKEGVLHRKGATPADAHQLGIIPANMRDGVYITKGLGNEKFLSSASHGCGRTMGRNAAKKNLDYDKFVGQMEGVVCSTDRSILDEAPEAYKDINYVMKAQEGITIDVVDFIKPVLNIKAKE